MVINERSVPIIIMPEKGVWISDGMGYGRTFKLDDEGGVVVKNEYCDENGGRVTRDWHVPTVVDLRDLKERIVINDISAQFRERKKRRGI